MGTKFTYMGAMCVLAERSDGWRVLFDPFLRNNPQTERSPEEFYDVDMVVITHGAGDHYGDAEEILKNGSAKVYCGSDLIRQLRRNIDIDPARTINAIFGDTRQLPGGSVIHTTIAAHHSKTVHHDVTVSAPAYGFIMEVEPGVHYYHAGDTSLFGDLRMYRELYRPTVMAVGISSFKAPGPPCEMGPREAAYAVSWIGPDVVIPTHYPEGSEAPQQFENHLKTLAPYTRVMKEIGRTFEYIPSEIRLL